MCSSDQALGSNVIGTSCRLDYNFVLTSISLPSTCVIDRRTRSRRAFKSTSSILNSRSAPNRRICVGEDLNDITLTSTGPGVGCDFSGGQVNVCCRSYWCTIRAGFRILANTLTFRNCVVKTHLED